jgi:hypothetical protein
MKEKIVYDSKVEAANQKNAKVTEKDIVYPKPPKNSAKAAKSTESAKPNLKNAEPEAITEFKTKINKYRFLHIQKKALSSLPFGPEKPLVARIDGDRLIIAEAEHTRLDQGQKKHMARNNLGDTDYIHTIPFCKTHLTIHSRLVRLK